MFDKVEFVGGNINGVVFTEKDNGRDMINKFKLKKGITYIVSGSEYTPIHINKNRLILKAPYTH